MNKINMEAYQAYYNTNESSLAAGNGIPPKTLDEEASQGQKEQHNMKIINNIMHINHSGANINIMCGGAGDEEKTGQQNNFIFNHTAPINLNFYEEVKKKVGNTYKSKSDVPAKQISGDSKVEVKEKSVEEAQEMVTKSPNRKIAKPQP